MQTVLFGSNPVQFDQRDCRICLQPFGQGSRVTQLACGHIFDEACFPASYVRCLTCRAPIAGRIRVHSAQEIRAMAMDIRDSLKALVGIVGDQPGCTAAIVDLIKERANPDAIDDPMIEVETVAKDMKVLANWVRTATFPGNAVMNEMVNRYAHQFVQRQMTRADLSDHDKAVAHIKLSRMSPEQLQRQAEKTGNTLITDLTRQLLLKMGVHVVGDIPVRNVLSDVAKKVYANAFSQPMWVEFLRQGLVRHLDASRAMIAGLSPHNARAILILEQDPDLRLFLQESLPIRTRCDYLTTALGIIILGGVIISDLAWGINR